MENNYSDVNKNYKDDGNFVKKYYPSSFPIDEYYKNFTNNSQLNELSSNNQNRFDLNKNFDFLNNKN